MRDTEALAAGVIPIRDHAACSTRISISQRREAAGAGPNNDEAAATVIGGVMNVLRLCSCVSFPAELRREHNRLHGPINLPPSRGN